MKVMETRRDETNAQAITIGKLYRKLPVLPVSIRKGRYAAIFVMVANIMAVASYLLVPLDFRVPGNDSSEPDTPPEVLVEYGEKPDLLSVTPTDPIDWLGTQFRRGLVRSA